AEQGVLRFVFTNIELAGGFYNTSLGATMVWDSSVLISGILSGNNNGTLQFINTIKVPDAATFEITGNPISWMSGTMEGPGILTNNSEINLVTPANKIITSNINLINNSLIAIQSSGDLYVNSGELHNAAAGTIDMQSDDTALTYSGGGDKQIINYGRIVKSAGSGTSFIYPPTTNHGILEAGSGTFHLASAFLFSNSETGQLTGTGTILLPASAADFINTGYISPGGNPGALTITGTYPSTNNSTLVVDINGLSISEHDQLILNPGGGFASIDVKLGFQPAVNDSFPTVVTTTGFPSCSVSVPAVVHDNLLFSFQTQCSGESNNILILRVIAIKAVDPIAVDQTFCLGATVANLTADGQNVQWYANSNGGTALAPDMLLSTGIYYVSQT